MISKSKGIPAGTTEKWIKKRDKFLQSKQVKSNLKKKKIGTGRKCAFPLTEEKLAKEIIERRQRNFKYSYREMVKKYKEYSEDENITKAENCKYSNKLFWGFFRRRRFVNRVKSCVKVSFSLASPFC